MNIVDSAHRTVHAYPGGSESLAPRIGMSAAVLRNKVNPNNTTHHLSLVEADEILSITGDHRMLHDLAAAHGYTLQRFEAQGSKASVLSLLLATNTSKGEFAHALDEALADGLITENEMRVIADAGTSVQAAMVVLLARLRAMAGQRTTGGTDA